MLIQYDIYVSETGNKKSVSNYVSHTNENHDASDELIRWKQAIGHCKTMLKWYG